jgi:malonyl-CoA/methylmalonyl-CoA synthetase
VRTLPERWATWWSARPDEEVLVIDGGSSGWLRADEVERRTSDIARGLIHLGCEPGDRVVWEAVASVPSVIVALAAIRAGLVLVPVSVRQSALERQTVIVDVEPALVVCAEEPMGAGGTWRWIAPSEVPTVEGGAGFPGPMGDDLALIVYTSGTTGDPKGAMITHANLAAEADALISAWGWTEDDRLVTALPLFHVHGLVVALMIGLSAGGSVVLQPTFDAGTFLAAIRHRAATMAFCVPTMLHRVAGDPQVEAVKALRLLVSGSAPLSVDLFEAFARRGVPILERYGMTETLLTVSNPLDGERRAGTVGLALPGVVLDAPAHGEAPRELRVSGPTVFPGYWRKPEATAEVLVDGWMATGDIVRTDEAGYLVVCGRSKELIITGGFNVYPTEVEDVLGGVPGVVEVAVVGIPSLEWGEEVVAHVVTADGELDLEALESRAEILSPYKRPRRYVVAAALPRNALGKLQRHLL